MKNKIFSVILINLFLINSLIHSAMLDSNIKTEFHCSDVLHVAHKYKNCDFVGNGMVLAHDCVWSMCLLNVETFEEVHKFDCKPELLFEMYRFFDPTRRFALFPSVNSSCQKKNFLLDLENFTVKSFNLDLSKLTYALDSSGKHLLKVNGSTIEFIDLDTMNVDYVINVPEEYVVGKCSMIGISPDSSRVVICVADLSKTFCNILIFDRESRELVVNIKTDKFFGNDFFSFKSIDFSADSSTVAISASIWEYSSFTSVAILDLNTSNVLHVIKGCAYRPVLNKNGTLCGVFCDLERVERSLFVNFDTEFLKSRFFWGVFDVRESKKCLHAIKSPINDSCPGTHMAFGSDGNVYMMLHDKYLYKVNLG